jgi:hypothetical protein
MPTACILILASPHRHESAKYDLDTLAPLPEPPTVAGVFATCHDLFPETTDKLVQVGRGTACLRLLRVWPC